MSDNQEGIEQQILLDFCVGLVTNALPQLQGEARSFDYLSPRTRYQLAELFRRQLIWCREMPMSSEVSGALERLRLDAQQLGYNCRGTYSELVASVYSSHVNGENPMRLGTFAMGLSYFLRFLAKVSQSVEQQRNSSSNSSFPQGMSEEELSSRASSLAQSPPTSPPNSVCSPEARGSQLSEKASLPPILPPLPEFPGSFRRRSCLLTDTLLEQSLHLAESLLDSASGVDEEFASLQDHQRIGIIHRDYLLRVLRYELVGVTPLMFLNMISKTPFQATVDFESVLDGATNILISLMGSDVWIDFVPSILASVALLQAFHDVRKIPIPPNILPPPADAVYNRVVEELARQPPQEVTSIQ